MSKVWPETEPSGGQWSVVTQPTPGPSSIAPAIRWLVASAGALVVASSYQRAADGGSPDVYYSIFWVGALLLVAPFATSLLARDRIERSGLSDVLALGVVTFVPKFLRNPYGPLYHDELAHYRATHDILVSHHLFAENPIIGIIGDFPGLHLVTATLQGVTGMPFWAAASVLMLVAHTASLVAIFALAQFVLPDGRAAGVAVLIYGANPSYLYFDTQFAYESLAVCFFLWILVLVASAGIAPRSNRPSNYGDSLRGQSAATKSGGAPWSWQAATEPEAAGAELEIWSWDLPDPAAIDRPPKTRLWASRTTHPVAYDSRSEAWSWDLPASTAHPARTRRPGRKNLAKTGGRVKHATIVRDLSVPRLRIRWRMAGATVLTMACISTHHLTTIVLIAVAALACVVHLAFRRLDTANSWRPWAFLLGTAVVGFGLWILTVADRTVAYLRPYAGNALHQLEEQASGASTGRTLFLASVQPVYERALGFGAPVVLIGLLSVTVLRTRLFAGWPTRLTHITLAAFGLVYFLSLPFIFTSEGAEGARRSWAFTQAALAVIVAPLLAHWRWEKGMPMWVRVLVPLGLFGLLVGNTGAGLNDAYRFPGPYRFGSDTRSLTTEVLAVSKQFGDSFPNQNIVSDRFTSLALDAYGHTSSASPGAGFRTYDLFLEEGDPAPYLVHELSSSDYNYIIVDERLSTSVPLIGIYFVKNEPIVLPGGRSAIPQAALDRFNTVPWASKVLTSSHYSVYRLDFASVGTPSCPTPRCNVAGR